MSLLLSRTIDIGKREDVRGLWLQYDAVLLTAMRRHIALLRIRIEVERQIALGSKKACWFLVPTVRIFPLDDDSQADCD